MDLLNLPTGFALLAFVGAAAGIVAWNRSRRGAELRRDVDAAAAPPAADAAPVAALAHAPERAPEPIPKFDGSAWASTEPMPGIALELQFADTMPAEMNFGATNFADTMPAEMNFGTTNFADTLVAELVVEERPSASAARPSPVTARARP